MSAAFAKAANTNTDAKAVISRRRENRPTEDRCGSRTISMPGATASTPTLSWGQARTQSRQTVQSRLPDLRGDELELSDWTNVFAKARAAEQRINSESHQKIVDD